MISAVAPLSKKVRNRTIWYLSHPGQWDFWPFLPVVRRTAQGQEDLGIVYDALTMLDLTGYGSTVFLCNLFLLPPRLEDFLTLPREVYDSTQELLDAGWGVD